MLLAYLAIVRMLDTAQQELELIVRSRARHDEMSRRPSDAGWNTGYQPKLGRIDRG